METSAVSFTLSEVQTQSLSIVSVSLHYSVVFKNTHLTPATPETRFMSLAAIDNYIYFYLCVSHFVYSTFLTHYRTYLSTF